MSLSYFIYFYVKFYVLEMCSSILFFFNKYRNLFSSLDISLYRASIYIPVIYIYSGLLLRIYRLKLVKYKAATDGVSVALKKKTIKEK